jgi:TonB family protein
MVAMNRPVVRLLALFVFSAGVAHSQSVLDSVRTANGYCHIWYAPPGFSNPSDLSYSRCAVDRPTRRLGGPDMPAPTIGTYAGGSIFITVRPDGTVDSALTRTSTVTSDTSFDAHVLETARQWRFEPALRNGVPVRSAFYLEISSTVRDDTMPSHLMWRYAEGGEQDTAFARWVVDTTRPPPLKATQADSVYAAVFRQLVRLQVLASDGRRLHCLIASSGDTLAARRLAAVARGTLGRASSGMTMSPGCERDPAFLRLVMPSIYRTERDRIVLFPRGDFLPVWPWGLDAKSWRAWTGRCVGRMLADGRAAMECNVNPISMAEEIVDASTARSIARPWVEGDSVRFTILSTRSGAFLVDTLHFTVGPLPILEQHAVIDSLLPCGGRTGYTSQPDSVFIVHGAVSGRSLEITPVHPSSRPRRWGVSARCPRRASSDGPFAAFFLGGIGAPATAPVHLCYSDCTYGYDIDPRRHTLAAAPVAVIRVSELRHETQLGRVDVMRVLMDHGPKDVTVFVVYHAGAWRPLSGLPLQTPERRWDFAFNLDGSRADTEFWVYMFRSRTSGAGFRK